jgi:hypothetical protein
MDFAVQRRSSTSVSCRLQLPGYKVKWRRDWDSKTTYNVHSTTCRASDDKLRPPKAMVRTLTERSFKRLSRRGQDTCDVFSGLSLAEDLDLGRYLMVVGSNKIHASTGRRIADGIFSGSPAPVSTISRCQGSNHCHKTRSQRFIRAFQERFSLSLTSGD